MDELYKTDYLLKRLRNDISVLQAENNNLSKHILDLLIWKKNFTKSVNEILQQLNQEK
jgi:hypothetical protein